MGLNPSNGIADRDHGPVFPNVAGHENPDDILRAELEAAGIKVFQSEILRKDKGEVKTAVVGDMGCWGFHRAWYYWVAEGPGIPPKYAYELHKTHGKEVRVSGHCGCPDPGYCGGFGVGVYHVDTQAGLKALADTIKRVKKDYEETK